MPATPPLLDGPPALAVSDHLQVGQTAWKNNGPLSGRGLPATSEDAKGRLDALRTCAANSQRLRGNAYPSVMPILEAQGLVARRNGGRLRRAAYWFLTPAGRELLAEAGMNEPRES